jgi:3-isopropylmalate/(R)-2-methylmalate dehydratase small subunit
MTDQNIFSTHSYNVAVDNIDTDQIIPAKFLTTTEREGMGRFCFHDWRFNDDGSVKASHALSAYDPGRHQVLVAGANFGCGSSREHAPWALLDFGIRAVISSQFADIFRGNALKNGLLPIAVDQEVVEFLHRHDDHPLTIDITRHTLIVEGLGEFEFPLDPFSAFCITRGIDQLDYLLRSEQDISAYEQRSNK